MDLAVGLPRAATRVEAALDWLLRSQEASGNGGSAAYFSPFWGWGNAYPETSGYIVPTLWRGADLFDAPYYAAAAEAMARWLLTLQSPEGWFPGGVLKASRERTPSIFNTGQIIFGLTEAARRTGDDLFWQAAERAALWLVDQQDPDGRWTHHAYVEGYSPSYYAHVCWPLAVFWRQNGDQRVQQCILRGLSAILEDRNENGTFRRWGFIEQKPAFTHTIAYTLQGMVESARLLDVWEHFGEPAATTALLIARKYELQHRLAGTYDQQWQGVAWYRCLTGHCQLASTWMRIYDETSDPRLLNVAAKALEEVCQHQRLEASRPNRHGAIAGSAPLYGSYMRMRYPNWAAKFFVDAMVELHDKLESLSPPGQKSGKWAA